MATLLFKLDGYVACRQKCLIYRKLGGNGST
jgi:hypothetical protein